MAPNWKEAYNILFAQLEEVQAENARLISAAPELLEALKHLEEQRSNPQLFAAYKRYMSIVDEIGPADQPDWWEDNH